MNNLILSAIAGIGGLCFIVVMSYESGLHDGRVEQQLEAGKQMVKNQVIDKKNNEIKYKDETNIGWELIDKHFQEEYS